MSSEQRPDDLRTTAGSRPVMLRSAPRLERGDPTRRPVRRVSGRGPDIRAVVHAPLTAQPLALGNRPSQSSVQRSAHSRPTSTGRVSTPLAETTALQERQGESGLDLHRHRAASPQPMPRRTPSVHVIPRMIWHGRCTPLRRTGGLPVPRDTVRLRGLLPRSTWIRPRSMA